MTEPAAALPTSGYALERVYARRQVCEAHANPEQYASKTKNDVTLGWDWRVTGSDRFEVLLSVESAPTKERYETVAVELVGVFRVVGQVQTVELRKFVQIHAVAILMPYAREIVSSLTARGFLGPTPTYLAPLNIQAIMEDMDAAVTTGFRQLEENPSALQIGGTDEPRRQLPSASGTT